MVALPLQNSVLCRSDTWAMQNPEKEAGKRSLEIEISFTISAVFPHTVQIVRITVSIPAHSIKYESFRLCIS